MTLAAFSGLLIACGGTPPSPPATAETGANPPAAVVESEAASTYQIVVPANDFAVGTPRLPLILFDGPDRGAIVDAIELTAYDTSVDPPLATWSGSATGYNDYEVPYWIAYPELPKAGIWGFEALITAADGSQSTNRFSIEVAENAFAPNVGEGVPASQNRTLATVEDINLLTSGEDPVPALYQMTVAEALTSDRPTVVSFSTPAYCQTAICAPVIRSVEAVQATQGERVNFIHLEIYKDFEEFVVADEVTEWNLQSEPWTFVLDREGLVVERMAGPVSEAELTAVLTPLLTR